MSYLDALRFHFSGNFFSDPSTVNNHEAHYTNSAFDRNKHWKRGSGSSPEHGWWNPEGANSFKFQNVGITGAMLAGGTPAAAGDAVLTCEFASRGRPPGKMVDLDPDQQMVSMIFGLNLALVGPQGQILLDTLFEPVPFTDIWNRDLRGGGDEAASVAYQSVLAVRSWGDLTGSAFLQALRQAAGDGPLSIKFNLDGYSMNPNNPRFATGRVVGTVAVARPDEPKHFVAGHHLGKEVHDLGLAFPSFRTDSGVNYCCGVFDGDRGKVRLDLGNALPVAPAGGPPRDIGPLFFACRKSDGSLSEIGEIAYRDAKWYEKTAGIAEIPSDRTVTAQERQLIENAGWCLVAHRQGQSVVVSEEPDAHIRADKFVARLDPGDRFTARFHVSRLGKPAANAKINLFFTFPGAPGVEGQFPFGGLTFPPTVTCDGEGNAEVEFVANDPGDPRFFHFADVTLRVDVDGQVYRIGYEVDGHEQPNPSNLLSILVWSKFVPDEPPTWHGSMRKVFVQYGNLYPYMTKFGPRLDLAAYDQIASDRNDIIAVVSSSNLDPSYMPVTRDLSRARRDAMLRWLREVGPDGKPLLGVAPAPAPEMVVAAKELEATEAVAEPELGSKTYAGLRISLVRRR
jgi:hypothetical protein